MRVVRTSELGMDSCSYLNYYVVMAQPTSVRLTDQQIEALDEIAEREERSRSWLISKAVDEYIARDKKSRKTTTEQAP